MYLALVLAAYLLGSISSAIVVCRAMEYPDPRQRGSGNPGATNVLRLHGKKAALITLLGDLLKGLLPLLVGKALGAPDAVLAAIGTAAFLGHLFPVFFGFKGGKGVATFVGVLYGIAWPLGVLFMLEWLLIAWLFRFSSLSALVAAVSSPVIATAFTPSPHLVGAVAVMVALIIYRHRSNITNLLRGTEGKIGAK